MNAAPATRLNLLNTQRRLEQLGRGRDLLRRKREALVAELFHLARPAADARARIAESAAAAYPTLLEVLSAEGHAGVRNLSWPTRELRVEIRPGVAWGVAVSSILERTTVRRSRGARGLGPGSVVSSAVTTADLFEGLTDLLLDAAPRELLLQRLGQALAQTSRQVNTLERQVAPGLRRDLARIRAVLEEREREEHVRRARLKGKLGHAVRVKAS